MNREIPKLIAFSLFANALFTLSVERSSEAQTLYERSQIEDPLVIHTLYINAHKSSGQPWDSQPLGAPDPYVKVYLNGDLAWTSRVWRDELQPISEPLTTSVYRRRWPSRDVDARPLAQVEVWDRDVLRDDLVASFMLSRSQLDAMQRAPLKLTSDALLLTLAWRSTPRRQSARATRRAVAAPKAEHSKTPQRLSRPLSRAARGAAPCEVIPPQPELTVTFQLQTTPQAVYKRAQALIAAQRARIERFNVTVRACRTGYDIKSTLGLGRGWVRLSDGAVTVIVSRPKLMRAFPSRQSVKRRVIRNMCRRVLKSQSPQCR